MKEKVMNGLEKFSKAMLSPLSYISAAGLILVLGALLTSTSLSAMIPVLQWTPIKLLGQLIYNCIMVIINNLSLMFCDLGDDALELLFTGAVVHPAADQTQQDAAEHAHIHRLDAEHGGLTGAVQTHQRISLGQHTQLITSWIIRSRSICSST